MNNLLTGIDSKIVGSALSVAVGGRHYEEDSVPDDAEYPYVVFGIVSDDPDENFTDTFEEVVIQFSLYSTSAGLTEITGMHSNLKSLFDNAALTISGSTFLHCRRKSFNRIPAENIVLPGGIQKRLRHWAVEYEFLTEK